jgi:hypothetical protein
LWGDPTQTRTIFGGRHLFYDEKKNSRKSAVKNSRKSAQNQTNWMINHLVILSNRIRLIGCFLSIIAIIASASYRFPCFVGACVFLLAPSSWFRNAVLGWGGILYWLSFISFCFLCVVVYWWCRSLSFSFSLRCTVFVWSSLVSSSKAGTKTKQDKKQNKTKHVCAVLCF